MGAGSALTDRCALGLAQSRRRWRGRVDAAPPAREACAQPSLLCACGSRRSTRWATCTAVAWRAGACARTRPRSVAVTCAGEVRQQPTCAWHAAWAPACAARCAQARPRARRAAEAARDTRHRREPVLRPRRTSGAATPGSAHSLSPALRAWAHGCLGYLAARRERRAVSRVQQARRRVRRLPARGEARVAALRAASYLATQGTPACFAGGGPAPPWCYAPRWCWFLRVPRGGFSKPAIYSGKARPLPSRTVESDKCALCRISDVVRTTDACDGNDEH